MRTNKSIFVNPQIILLEAKPSADTGHFDHSTFEKLFREEYKPLVYFALKYVKDMETARELVQESFLSLWERKHTINPAKPVRSYMFTTVHNRCLNHLRDTNKFSASLLEIENLLEMQEPGNHDQLVAAELKERIDRAVEELPEKCREIFILNRFENLKYAEIAKKLDISVKTVEAQMSKALQHMRERLSEYTPAAGILVVLLHKLVG